MLPDDSTTANVSTTVTTNHRDTPIPNVMRLSPGEGESMARAVSDTYDKRVSPRSGVSVSGVTSETREPA